MSPYGESGEPEGALWARLLSTLFQPYAALTYWLALLGALGRGGAPRSAVASAWLAAVALPVAALLLGKRRGWWGGSELVTRAERFVYLPVAWAGSALAWALARRWAARSLLEGSLEAILAWLTLVTLLTLAWKVSLHTGATGLMTGMGALLLRRAAGPAAAWAALAAGTLLAAAVAAARLALRRHTPAQLAVGYLLGLAAVGLLLARGGGLPLP